jgi:hypothetical protein
MRTRRARTGAERSDRAAERETGVIAMYAGPTKDEMAIFPTRVVGLPGGASAFVFTLFQGRA